ncbi:putative BPI/LBP family protein [Iris pallida]|uniref:BPI/LBP family protein n=1 Tax=Iris pallida TaxID=29817 RepID=A0AAX6HWM3_IRIPA|nr:putative BPI/LBP family protein [Iris pallida]
MHENSMLSDSCLGTSSMLGISLDEAAFNSAAAVYFQEGLMHWLVDKVPDQSLLNTARWKYIVPQLYRKYPNDNMQLNLTLTSPPIISIKPEGAGGTITTDMTVNVLDAGESVPVACITVVISVSGVVKISGNNLAGEARLQDFTLNLKWSKVGNFHMFLIQETMWVFLNTVFMPIINSHLRKGFPLPIVHGFTLQNAYILNSSSKMVVCSDVIFRNSTVAAHFPL